MLLLGLIARGWLVSQHELVFRDDMQFFTAWTRGLATLGLAGFYENTRFCDYPPLSILLFQAIGTAAGWVDGGEPRDETLQALVKSLACLFDLALLFAIFVEGRRLIGAAQALAASALYFLNPVVLYNSAYWGQLDSVHTALVMFALICTTRRAWLGAGVFAALALLAKFQAIALLPIVIFELYRLGGWRAIGLKLLAGVAAAAVILAPFAWSGTLRTVLERSYINVVGQYHDLSKNAYNLWYLVAPPTTADTDVPLIVARAAAQGRVEIAETDAWLLRLTYRHVSLLLYALSVAVILSLYGLRPAAGGVAVYGAAGLLGLAFFLFPTEMHERYAFPALAFLSLWAVSSPWRERLFMLLSALMLLNVAAVFSPAHLAPLIAMALLCGFGVVLVGLVRQTLPASPHASYPEKASSARLEDFAPCRALIVAFQAATGAALVAALSLAVWVAVRGGLASSPIDPPGATFLSALPPLRIEQGYKTPARDRSVEGGLLRLGGRIHFRGLGTHAPSLVEYDVPPNATRFRAVVGIDAVTGAQGSAIVVVELDGVEFYRSHRLTGGSAPIHVDVPLTGAKRIGLRALPTEDGPRADHVDWAQARFE